MRTAAHGCRGERGQAVPLVLGLVAVAVVVLLALVPLAQAAQQRAAARNAADAAALAGAAEGEAAAREVAAENGARAGRLARARASTCGWWSRSATPAPRPRRAATAERGAQERERGCPTLDPMPPDEPGAPSPGPRDTGSTATFRRASSRPTLPNR